MDDMTIAAAADFEPPTAKRPATRASGDHAAGAARLQIVGARLCRTIDRIEADLQALLDQLNRAGDGTLAEPSDCVGAVVAQGRTARKRRRPEPALRAAKPAQKL